MFSSIITAWNEPQSEVDATVKSILDGMPGSEIILIDDGSDVPIKADSRVKLIRHDKPLGVGNSRNDGLSHASGNIVAFFDAHMRFEPGVLDKAFGIARHNYGIVNPPSAGMDGGGGWCGCNMYWNQRDLIEPKWIFKGQINSYPVFKGDLHRVACMMGANYFMNREVIRDLQQPTGFLWDDIKGRWGFSEQALAVKAYLMNVPIIAYVDSAACRHLYRSTNPVKTAAIEKFANAAWSMSALLHSDTFETRFKPFIEPRYKGLEYSPPIYHPWSIRDEREMFNRLFGLNPPIYNDRKPIDHLIYEEHGSYKRAFVGRAGEALAALYYKSDVVEYVETSPYREFHWGRFGNKVDRPSGHYDIALVTDKKAFDESGATAYNTIVDVDLDKYMVVPSVLDEERKALLAV